MHISIFICFLSVGWMTDWTADSWLTDWLTDRLLAWYYNVLSQSSTYSKLPPPKWQTFVDQPRLELKEIWEQKPYSNVAGKQLIFLPSK